MTEGEAQAEGLECECRSIPLDLIPRALVNRDTRGVVKIVAEKETGLIRGVHMLAPNAGDAILASVYAIECGMTVEQLANIWCPYLTISEGIKLAAQAFTIDIAKALVLRRVVRISEVRISLWTTSWSMLQDPHRRP